jgi:hypothetical protein
VAGVTGAAREALGARRGAGSSARRAPRARAATTCDR